MKGWSARSLSVLAAVLLVSACASFPENPALEGYAPSDGIPAPRKVEFYPIEVILDYIVDGDESAYFQNLPTRFQLPAEDLDKLRAIGRSPTSVPRAAPLPGPQRRIEGFKHA